MEREAATWRVPHLPGELDRVHVPHGHHLDERALLRRQEHLACGAPIVTKTATGVSQ